MYYVIEIDYAGPNAQQHLNDHAFEIHSEPARGNSGDHPIILDGWCGTTNDWAVYAHGEHETLETARAEIERQTGGDHREAEVEGHEVMVDTPDGDLVNIVIERYLVGNRAQLTADESRDLAYPAVDEITAATTDAEIDALVDECVREFREPAAVGAEADADAIRDLFIEARDDARADDDE